MFKDQIATILKSILREGVKEMGRKEMKKEQMMKKKRKNKKLMVGTMVVGLLAPSLILTVSTVYAVGDGQAVVESTVESSKSSTESTTDSIGEAMLDSSAAIIIESDEETAISSEDTSDIRSKNQVYREKVVPESSLVSEVATDSEARAVLTATWGTSPIVFDSETGTLTVSAGTLISNSSSTEVVPGSGIPKNAVKEIIFENGVVAPENSSFLFSGILYEERFQNLTSIYGLIDTSSVSNMENMFYGASSLMNLDVSGWDTSSVIDMSYMFSEASSLVSIDVSGWNTSSVMDMNSMFGETSSLTSVDVSAWDTKNVTDTGMMFDGASSLMNLDVSAWNTVSVTNMGGMFRRASSLTNVDVSGWNTSNTTNIGMMFDGASSLTNVDVSKWNTSNVITMSYMFNGATSLTSIDVSDWNTASVVNMEMMFNGATSLTSIDVSGWNTTNVMDMIGLFGKNPNLAEITLGLKSIFNTSVNLTDISTASGEYTGAWERISPAVPIKVYDSSPDFMSGYDGSMPGTYVWQKLKNLTTVEVKDSTIYVGSSWTPINNFVSATDTNGNLIDFSQVTVLGTVNTITPGRYEVIYSYGGVEQTATITVLENQTNIQGKNSTITVGDSWSPEDNFVSAMDKDGNLIDFSQVTVSGTVDSTRPGIYEITYSYGGQSTTIVVTVVNKELEKPVKPTNPEKKTPSVGQMNSTKPIGKSQSNNALPKAGEKYFETTLLNLLGIGIVASATWFIGIKKWFRDDKN